MIKLEHTTVNGFLDDVNFCMAEGEACVILTETDLDKKLLIRLLTGIIMPDSGKVFIFGEETSSLGHDNLDEIRKRIGVVLNNGGLISNLKIWENIMLPAMYHTDQSQETIEKNMTDILEKIGYDDTLEVLPGHLPSYKKRLIGFARAALMDPDIMIYDSIFDGLSLDMRNKIISIIDSFHGSKNGRRSLFLTSNENSANQIKTGKAYRLKDRKVYEGN
jgi:phospholipid/cholesterol/gamma-HCH transport system ATP-binding protein